MARMQTVAGYPVEHHNSPNRGAEPMSDHRGVVLHISEGSYRGCISWQMNPDQRYADGTKVNTCSTFILGKAEGEVAQMVDSDEIAWCQRSGSRTWLSIEHAGTHDDPAVPTAWQKRAAAEIFLWSHQRYGHALAIANTDADRGLGHHSMDREAFGVEWGHEQCPGPSMIAAKPAILSIAQSLLDGGDDMTPAELLATKLSPSGITINNALSTLLLRVPTNLNAQLAAILREASDDPAVPVEFTAEQVEALAVRLAAGVSGQLADAVVDEQATRLQS